MYHFPKSHMNVLNYTDHCGIPTRSQFGLPHAFLHCIFDLLVGSIFLFRCLAKGSFPAEAPAFLQLLVLSEKQPHHWVYQFVVTCRLDDSTEEKNKISKYSMIFQVDRCFYVAFTLSKMRYHPKLLDKCQLCPICISRGIIFWLC